MAKPLDAPALAVMLRALHRMVIDNPLSSKDAKALVRRQREALERRGVARDD